jgi:signal transduction histidine kinase
VAAFRKRNPGREVKYEPSNGLPPVSGQPAWIGQVLENLLSNASKYSPQEEPIEVLLEAREGGVAVRVIDCGEGIPEDEIDYIFEPFYRSQRTESSASGLGLGLAVCRRLMDLQGGSIRCNHSDCGGSEFEFTLVLEQDAE